MSDQEWLAYLDTLPPELADLAGHIMERINTVLSRERSRTVSDYQEAYQRLDVQQTKLADLRMIIADVVNQLREREAGGGAQ